MATMIELTGIRAKAEAEGWLKEFDVLVQEIIQREQRATAAEEDARRRLDVMTAVARVVGWENPTPTQLLHLAQPVAALRAQAARSDGGPAEFLRGWITGHLEALGVTEGPQFSTAEAAVRHLAALYREAIKAPNPQGKPGEKPETDAE